MKKMKTALIGSGMISGIYLKNLKSFDLIDLVGCSDIVPERSKQRAEEYGIRQMTNEEIFSDPEIEMVVNTTYPLAHYEVDKAALMAGKHVYTEKMMVETLEQARELKALAEEKHLFLGGAPDTWLAGGIQLARQIVDSGMVGAPTMAQVFLSRSYHHERFYAGAEKRFAFCRHGGIPFDMGAYYLTPLVFLMGSIQQVNGFAQIRDPHRTYMNPKCPLYGQEMLVESWNQVTGAMKFAGGALASFTLTSEGGAFRNSFVVHCTDGAIDLGDPNRYDGAIKVYNKQGEESIVHSGHGYQNGNFRGIGVLDAAYAIRAGKQARCNGDLCTHVLEATLGLVACAQTGKTYEMTTQVERPQPLRTGHTEYPELVFLER